jgi:Tfp pilus assembly protein PilE
LNQERFVATATTTAKKLNTDLETRLDAAVNVAMRVFRFATMAAADGLRFVDCTFTVDALPDSGMERKVRRDDFWS